MYLYLQKDLGLLYRDKILIQEHPQHSWSFLPLALGNIKARCSQRLDFSTQILIEIDALSQELLTPLVNSS